MASNIDDVAKAAGVSIATVSRVLSDKPNVKSATRERVLSAVAQLNYRPSRVAQSLRSQQAQSIGLIISDIQNPFFTSLARAVEDYAYEHNYTLLLCNSDEDPKKELLYINLMMAENVAGIIISPTGGAEAAHRQLARSEIAVVSVDRRIAEVSFDTVVSENRAASARLISHLIQNNHRRIGAVMGTSSISSTRERQEGYRQALFEHDIPFDPDLLRKGIPKIQTGYELTNTLLALKERPSALFTGNNLLTLGSLRAIHEHGLSIPNDIAVVAYDEMDWMFVLEPSLTVVAQPIYQMGQKAAELLLERITTPSRPVTEVVFEPQIHFRQSSAVVRAIP